MTYITCITHITFQKNNERLWKEARERYKNISKEEKDKRRKKARERYQNCYKK